MLNRLNSHQSNNFPFLIPPNPPPMPLKPPSLNTDVENPLRNPLSTLDFSNPREETKT